MQNTYLLFLIKSFLLKKSISVQPYLCIQPGIYSYKIYFCFLLILHRQHTRHSTPTHRYYKTWRRGSETSSYTWSLPPSSEFSTPPHWFASKQTHPAPWLAISPHSPDPWSRLLSLASEVGGAVSRPHSEWLRGRWWRSDVWLHRCTSCPGTGNRWTNCQAQICEWRNFKWVNTKITL